MSYAKKLFQIAWRNLIKNRLFTLINIAGLSIGSICFLFIVLYVYNQHQYDKHHEAGKSLYRVETKLVTSGESFISATISPPTVPMMQQDFPEVMNATRVVDPPETSHHILKWKNTTFFETKGYYVDSTFFSMFDYEWVEGQAITALQEPYTVVLTKKVKEKLFGRYDALGETIQINNRFGSNEFKVTGVVDPTTHKSHIRPNFYMSMNSGGMGEYVRNNNQWAGGNFIHGYVELHPSTDPNTLLTKLPDFLQKHGGDQFREFGSEKTLSLQLVSDIHLGSVREGQLDVTGNARLLKILLLIALFILAIACINFMNLATAQSLKKGMELGVRKTIGASRLDIAKQFYVETFLLAGISFLLAIAGINYFMPFVSNFAGEEIQLAVFSSPLALIGLISVYILTALIAGSYPAFFLSSFKPASVIKGAVEKRKGQDLIRKSLVVLQFTISVSLIIGSMVIMNQLKFMTGKDLGFDKQQKVVVPFRTSDAREQLAIFKKETLQISGVEKAAGARVYPGQFMAQDFNLYKEGADMNESHNVNLIQGDEDYLQTLDIPILHGRNFFVRDTARQILINQTALRSFNISDDEAIGKKLFSDYRGRVNSYEIIGVVKDYHQGSLKDQIQPIIFEYRPTARNLALLVDVNTESLQTLIADLEKNWNQMIPETPFEYRFLDEQIQSQYMQEIKLMKILNLFTFITIFISCLGLFGLAAFMAEQRTKEIGIRKVLGASVMGIVGLLSKDFIKLVLIALIIAVPISCYFLNEWLQTFAYHINIQWWVFLLAGLSTVVIAFLTVSFQSLKAALSNPVNSIKSE